MYKNSTFQLLESRKYHAALVAAIKGAKQTITIISLSYVYDNVTNDIGDALLAAAKRGVKVNLAFDTFTYLELKGWPLGPINLDHPSGNDTRKHIDELKAVGAIVTMLGETKPLNPYKGRTHTKWSVIDNTVFSFGGVNLYKIGFAATDYMLVTTNASLAERLRYEHSQIVTSQKNYQGAEYELNHNNRWFIDSGQPNNSIIYNRAVELAQKAVAITYVSQYCPTGPLVKFLKNSSASLYFNQASNYSSLASKLMLVVSQTINQVQNNYQLPTYLHAKFIIFKLSDGTYRALTGSHNYNYAGVKFGTKEIALESSEQQVIKLLQQFIQRSIDPTYQEI